MELAVARGDDPGLEEGARARPHLGVVAGQEEVGPGPLQDGGGRGGGRRRPRQGGPHLGEVAEEGVPLVRQGADEALVRAQVDPGQGAGGWTTPSAASCRRAATRSGPAVWGRRSSDWDRPTASMPVWATCSAAPDRSWTERSWRPATGRTSTGQSSGDESRPCAALKLGGGRAEGPDGGAGQDAVGGEALPGRLDRRLALVDVLGGHHHDDDGGDRPDHHERPTTTAAIFHRPVKRRRAGRAARPGPVGGCPRRSVARARRCSPGGAYCRGRRSRRHPASGGELSVRPAASGLRGFRAFRLGWSTGGEFVGQLCPCHGRHYDLWLCPARPDSLE